jgi:hypothetical protein
MAENNNLLLVAIGVIAIFGIGILIGVNIASVKNNVQFAQSTPTYVQVPNSLVATPMGLRR